MVAGYNGLTFNYTTGVLSGTLTGLIGDGTEIFTKYFKAFNELGGGPHVRLFFKFIP